MAERSPNDPGCDIGRRIAAAADRHGFDASAAWAAYEALRRGSGRMAQFDHPALGGMGQWSPGGMVMIGEMFNHALKARVDALCTDLARLTGEPAAAMPSWGSAAPGSATSASAESGSAAAGSAAHAAAPVPPPAPQPGADRTDAPSRTDRTAPPLRNDQTAPSSGSDPAFPPFRTDHWWPDSLGVPAAVGSQNDVRYAYFPGARRLAFEQAGRLAVYDTGEHRISGFAQQQGPAMDWRFTSQLGEVSLRDLRRCADDQG